MKGLKQIFAFLALLFVSISTTSHAQNENRSLLESLKDLEQKHGLRFSFDSDLITGINTTLLNIEDLDASLKVLSEETNLIFELIGERNYLISPQKMPICLTILDKKGKTSIPGAYAIHNGQYFDAVSSIDGKLEFESNLTIKDTIKIRYLGYEDLSVPVYNAYKAPCMQAEMSLGHTVLNEVIITNYMAPGITTSSEDHHIEIKTTDLALLPGETDGDILLSLRTVPGITSPSGKAGNLHVRGSTSDQTLILFDNIPIYHKGHYLGVISPYNPKMVDEIEIHRSGFEPRLGGRVGGAIELKTARNVIDSTQFGVGLNTYFGSAFAKVPLLKDKVMISAAYRQSFPDSFDSPKLAAIKDMVYQTSMVTFAERDPNRQVERNNLRFSDLNANAVIGVNKGVISTSFLRVDNKNEVLIQNANNSIMRSKTSLENWGISSEWSQYWSSRFNTKLSAMSSEYGYHSDVEEVDPQGTVRPINIFTNGINDFNLNLDGAYLFNKSRNYSLEFGYSYNQQTVDETSLIQVMGTPSERGDHIVGALHSVYLNSSISILQEKLTLNGGLRSNYYDQLDDYRIEPRLFLNYALNNTFSIKSSFGLYSQYINQLVYFDFEDSRVENLTWLLAGTTPIVTSNQGMFGAVFSRNNWTLDLELYAKQVEGLSTRNPYALPNDPEQFIHGNLKTIGMDVLIKKSWDNVYVWGSYTLARSEMQFLDLNQISFPAYYDQPHVVSLVTTIPMNKWAFSLGWNYSSGTPNYLNASFFPDPAAQQALTPPSVIPSETNSGRFTPQHQLDLSAVYTFINNKSINGSIGLSILNIYDKENLVEQAYFTQRGTTTQESRYAIGFAPNLTLNIEW